MECVVYNKTDALPDMGNVAWPFWKNISETIDVYMSIPIVQIARAITNLSFE
jgi:hypothetical protein